MCNDKDSLNTELLFEPDGRLPLFPEASFSVSFRYGMRLRDNLDLSVVVREPPSRHLPPVMAAAPPVLLIDRGGKQELINRATLDSHVIPPLATPHQAYCVIEIPVSDWHSREVQFLRFYYRHIEPARLGLEVNRGEEPYWKSALREILGSGWLYRYLCRQVAADEDLSNELLSRIIWHQASPRTIANFKSELRKAGGVYEGIGTPARSKPAAKVYTLDDYRS